MGDILHGRYAVVSCHVERPLDDEAWRRFPPLQERRPGGFAIAALMRPPAEGEDERLLARAGARGGTAHGPFGHHTHWTAPDHARPTGGDPAARVLEQGALAALGRPRGPLLLRRRLVHGRERRRSGRRARLRRLHGDRVPARLSRARTLRTSSCTSRRGWGCRRPAPARAADDALARHARARSARSLSAGIVHVYFHDTDLLDVRRRAALRVGLAFLGLKRTALDLGELQRGLRPEKTMSFANSRA